MNYFFVGLVEIWIVSGFQVFELIKLIAFMRAELGRRMWAERFRAGIRFQV